jgi:hypothetical protein
VTRFACWALLLVTVGVAAVAPAPAHGHTRSVSYSTWTVAEGSARVVVRVRAVEATALASPNVLPRLVRLTGCEPNGTVDRLTAPAGWYRFSWTVTCGTPPTAAGSDLLFDALPTHLHFASVDGHESVLTASRRVVNLEGPPSLWSWARLGAEHVASGADHLAFLLLILLVARTRRRVLAGITAFTLGHALSLVGASLGYIAVDGAGAEVLIAASVLVFALEAGATRTGRNAIVVAGVGGAASLLVATVNPVASVALAGMTLTAACSVSAQPNRWVWVGMVAMFGLVHGLGFAETLRALGPDAVQPLPLALFNVGVEASQVAIALLVWPLLGWARTWRPTAAWLEPALVAICAGLGMFWTVTRVFAWAVVP